MFHALDSCGRAALVTSNASRDVWLRIISHAVLAVIVVSVVFVSELSYSQTLTILYSFKGGTDGVNPYGALVRDPAGNLYGTTEIGGTYNLGTVFKVDSAGNETVLHSFGGPGDGLFPYCTLVRDSAGNLYGTATIGGAQGQGVVFKIDAQGNETLLHSFGPPPDGAQAYGSLVRDSAGNLYGTTSEGGTIGWGIVFKLDRSGNLTTLYNFAGPPDGQSPQYGALAHDGSGNFYATTYTGGTDGFGTVYKLDSTGQETILHNFTGQSDGLSPLSTLLLSSGKLYGTSSGGYGFDSGTVFEVTTTGKFRTLYTFTGGVDGQFPDAGLIRDQKGNFYGTAAGGGTFGGGVVFELSPMGKETVLHSFALTRGDGSVPQGALIRDSSGNLFGTTQNGGAFGYGTVFKLTP